MNVDILKERPRSDVNFKMIVIILVLATLLGFEVTELFVKGGYVDGLTSFDENLLNNPGVLFFFKYNISFFLIVSVLPFINLPICFIQLVVTGINMRLIANLGIGEQIEIFYRHFIFECSALLLSLYVSLILYKVVRKMHKERTYQWKKDVKYILFIYFLICLFTVIAAILEGGAFV